MTIFRYAVRFLCLLAVSPALSAEEMRDWTSSDGRKLAGVLLGVDGATMVIRTKDGGRMVIPVEKLDGGDQSFLRNWQRGRSPELALPPVVWPAEVFAGNVTLGKPEMRTTGWWVRTEHYQFLCDAELATAAVMDLATAGEATHRWLRAWPLRLPEESSAELPLARILRTREAYEAAGAPKESGGFFRRNRDGKGELLVPFESIGLETSPNSAAYRKGMAFSTRTLIHEMTHQQMSPVLRFLPLWLSEGLAELAALPDYRAGKFQVTREMMILRLRQRLEDYLGRDPATGGELSGGKKAEAKDWMLPLNRLLEIQEGGNAWAQSSLADKHRIYLTSLFTAFYFMYLDGDGQARRLRVYWNEVLAAQQYYASHAQAGRLPARVASEGWNLDRETLRVALMERLLSGEPISSLQADVAKRLNSAGVRVAFPQEAGN